MTGGRDTAIIRELAAHTAEIAAMPVQEEKRRLWRRLNGLDPVRPMVMIDQVCWNEMEVDGELALRCADPERRSYERDLRRTLYQWKHFPVDMVVEPFVRVPLAIRGTDFGITTQEDIAVTDPANEVVGHKFHNQFQDDADLEKMHLPRVSHDEVETRRRLSVAHDLFDGLLEVKPGGADLHCTLWDPISQWMSVEGALYALVDRPEFMHRLAARMTDGYLGLFDQLEAQGLLCQPQSLVHCTGAWTDDLPAPGYDPARPRTRDIWGTGLAQMFATVSPAMFREFEVNYVARIFSRFGLVYYGCCDPLDRKMNEVRMIPNVRKISMSPWADQERGAAEIGRGYVFSRKPSPAFLAGDRFDEERVRTDLLATRAVCERHGCPLEYILKDISTVGHRPERLFAWARIAMEVVGG
jgi:hypothetical protein